MKLKLKKFLPHTLIFMLIASSPVNVLSTTAYASSVDQPPLNVIDKELDMPTVKEPNQTPSGNDSPTPSQENEVEQTTFDERFEKAKETMESKRTYLQKRELVQTAIEAFQEDQSIEKLQLAMDYVVLLPKSPTENNKGDKVEFSSLISNLVEFLEDGEEKEALLFHYADKAIAQTWETLTHLDLDIAIKAVHLLPEGKEKEQYKKEAEKVYKEVYKKHSNPGTGFIDWSDPNIEYGEPPKKETGRDNWRPGVDGDKYLEDYYKNKPNRDDYKFNEGFSNIRYNYENGACYKTTMEYDSKGNLIKRVKDKANASEKTFCNVEIPQKGISDYYKSSSWTRNYVSQLDGSPESGGDTLSNYKKQKQADLETLSTDTIQYTFEKDSDSPYYYDTGIYVSKDGTITYQQARDALFQISVQGQGKFVEDVDKALALLDGLIILVEDDKKPIPVEEFIASFDETSIGVKAQGTRSGDKYELADLIEVKEVASVIVNGKTVELEAKPIIDNSFVLFPIDNISKSLGGKVSKTDNSTTVEYKGNRITFTDSDGTAKVDEVVKPLNAPTRQNKDGVRMVDIDALLDFFGLTLEVKSDTDEIIIKNK